MTQTDLSQYFRDSHTLPRTTQLVRETGLRSILLHLNAGETIPEHQAPGAITVQCLTGEVTFNAGEEKAQLTGGRLISLAPRQPHSLSATQESLLLVTLSEQPPEKT